MLFTSQGKDNLSNKKLFHRWIAKWSRWSHIYLSMMSLAAILFFSLTGFTLNHPDWFFRESSTSVNGALDPAVLNLKTPAPLDWDQSDYGHEIDKLNVVEHLRSSHRIFGRLSEFLSFQDECEVTFQGPGYAATARIKRDTGTYQLTTTCNDLVSVLNDLHKGRNTGPIWSLVIDVSAIVSAAVALSGFLLIFYLKLNRSMRIFLAVAGTVLLIILCRIAVN